MDLSKGNKKFLIEELSPEWEISFDITLLDRTSQWRNVFVFTEGYPELFTGEAAAVNVELYRLPGVWFIDQKMLIQFIDKIRGTNQKYEMEVSIGIEFSWVIRQSLFESVNGTEFRLQIDFEGVTVFDEASDFGHVYNDVIGYFSSSYYFDVANVNLKDFQHSATLQPYTRLGNLISIIIFVLFS